MADSTGKIISMVAVVGGAYVLYEWLKGQCATSGSMLYGNSVCGALGMTTGAAPVPPIVPAPVLPPAPVQTGGGSGAGAGSGGGGGPVYTGGGSGGGGGSIPTTGLAQLLQAAAGGVSTLNADQWSYYYAGLTGRTAISPGQFETLFFPNGRPSDPSQYPMYTAAQWAAIAQGGGLHGLGAQVVGGSHDYTPGLTVGQPSIWQDIQNWFNSLFGGGNANPPNVYQPAPILPPPPVNPAFTQGPILPPPPVNPAFIHGGGVQTTHFCPQGQSWDDNLNICRPMMPVDPASLPMYQNLPFAGPQFPGGFPNMPFMPAQLPISRFTASIAPSFQPGSGYDFMSGPGGGAQMSLPDASGMMGLGDDIGYPAWAIHGGTRG